MHGVWAMGAVMAVGAVTDVILASSTAAGIVWLSFLGVLLLAAMVLRPAPRATDARPPGTDSEVR